MDVAPVAEMLELKCPACGWQLEDRIGPLWCPSCETFVSIFEACPAAGYMLAFLGLWAEVSRKLREP